MRLACLKVSDVPEDWMPALRSLTIPDLFAMSRWLYSDGSTYTCVLFDGDPADPIQPWQARAQAILHFCDEPHPVLGVYVSPMHRGKGYAVATAQMVLCAYKGQINARGGIVYAASHRWGKYPQLIEANGFEHYEWE